MCVCGAAFLRPYTYTSGAGLYVFGFLEQFCVQGAWGVMPIHLAGLSPPAWKTFVIGTSYQLGNLISAASNTIEAKIGERYPLEEQNGLPVYDYRPVIAILGACAFVYVIIFTILGPEKEEEKLELGTEMR